jgi:hypothetical protein
MKFLRYLAAAALAACFFVPSAAQAQTNNRGLGNNGYGIFGDGSNHNGIYNGTSMNNNFRRNYSYSQSQIGNFVQGAYTGAYITPLGAYGLGANGTGGGGSLGPYMNILRYGSGGWGNGNYANGGRGNYRGGDGWNGGDWATNFKQAERQGEEELRAQQGLDANLANVDWSQSYKQAEFEGEKEARRRAGENPEPEFRDWATSYKDQEIQGEAKMEKDRMKSKQRAANLRQANALKALEGELAGSSASSKNVAPPSLASGLQSYHGALFPSQFKSMTHYYPSQGLPVSRIGGR